MERLRFEEMRAQMKLDEEGSADAEFDEMLANNPALRGVNVVV